MGDFCVKMKDGNTVTPALKPSHIINIKAFFFLQGMFEDVSKSSF